MNSATKLKTLQDLRFKLETGQISQQEKDGVHLQDTDGTKVPLNDPGALAVLDRRIAAEGGASPPGQ